MQGSLVRKRRFGLYFSLAGVWLALIVSLGAAIIARDFNHARHHLVENVRNIQHHITDIIDANEAILEGFAAYLEVQGDLYSEETVAYAHRLMRHSPSVYQLEAVREIPDSELGAFVGTMRQMGNPNFTVKTFTYNGERTWAPVAPKSQYYPLVFMQPVTSESQEVLGLDIESVDFLWQALSKSASMGEAVATKPFFLVEGDLAMVVFRPVSPWNEIQNGFRKTFAALVIKAHDLFANLPDSMADDLNLLLFHQHMGRANPDGFLFRHVATESESLLPRIRVARHLELINQPYVMSVERQLTMKDWSWDLLTTLMGGAMFTLAAMLAFARSFHRRKLARLAEENRLFYLANYDSLTRLPNRNLLMDRLQHALLQAQREATRVALLFLDLDRFKQANDRYGHRVGDQLLRLWGERLRACLRVNDTVGRLGGDEFLVILEHVTSRDHAYSVAANIREQAVQPFEINGHEVRLEVSIGFALYPEDGEDIDRLIGHADRQMYAAKRDSDGLAKQRCDNE